MEKLLKHSRDEYAALTREIKEFESRIEFLSRSILKQRHSEVVDAEPKQKFPDAVKSESSELLCSTEKKDDLLLSKVDDILVKASMVMNCKDPEKSQLIPKQSLLGPRSLPKAVSQKPKLKGKLSNKNEVIAKVDTSKRKISHQIQLNQGTRVPSKLVNHPQNDPAVVDQDILLAKRRKRLQIKYLRVAKVIEKLNECQKDFHKLKPCVHSDKNIKSFQDLPELNCIYKILHHLLESYIIPGDYSIDNIRAITKKTDEQFAALVPNMCSQQNISTAQSLLASTYNLKAFAENSVTSKLNFVAFSKHQQISKCLTTYTKMLTARLYSELLQELLSFFSLKSLTEDVTLIQLTKFILSDRKFIPPVVYNTQ